MLSNTLRNTLRRLREAIGNATITVGYLQVSLVTPELPRPESVLVQGHLRVEPLGPRRSAAVPTIRCGS